MSRMTLSHRFWMGAGRVLGHALVLGVAMVAGSGTNAPAAEPQRSATRFEAPTMFVMNSPTALARLEKGFFDQVYRGFGTRKADRIERDELLGFHFLLDTDFQTHALRALVRKHESAGLAPEAADRAARQEHVRVLTQVFGRLESLRNLFENYRDKNEMLTKTGMPDPESHFVFTSPNLAVAKFYGPIVMVIEESRQRGLDLNSIARDSRYYSVARFLKNLAEFQFRAILSDYVADRDEYVLPSYLTPADVTGLIVYDPSPMVIGNRIAVPPPAVRRVYRKQFRRGGMAIDVFDGRDRLIARLSASPTAAEIPASITRSPEPLPPAILAAWKSYVARLPHISRRQGAGAAPHADVALPSMAEDSNVAPSVSR